MSPPKDLELEDEVQLIEEANRRKKAKLDRLLKGVNNLKGLNRQTKVDYFKSLAKDSFPHISDADLQGHIDAIR
jgi:hypothetical protein